MTRRSRTLLWLLTGAVALLLLLGWDQGQLITGWGLPARTGPPMLLVAHRGNMSQWPEDTLPAILDAARLGADGIEIDVHQSADGTWWVMHDATVDRTTDGSGLVAELDDDAMETLRIDAGAGFDPERDSAVRPPRLTEVLDDLDGYDGLLLVDIQHAVTVNLADLAARLAGRRAAVICRSTAEVTALNAIDPHVGTFLRVDRLESGTAVDYAFYEAVSEATVGQVAAEELPVATYRDDRYSYLQDEWVLRRAWAAGVDIYLTNELEAALSLRDELSAGSEPEEP